MRRKKILVLMSEGGGGHKVASHAIEKILQPQYDVDVVSALPSIMKKVDFFTLFTSGAFTGDDFYNFLLRSGYHRAVSMLAKIGIKYMSARRHHIKKIFCSYLNQQKEKYDLVISTFPYINSGLALAAQRLNIPFMIIPTDLDTATFFTNLSKHVNFEEGGRFAFALAYNDKDLKAKAFRKGWLPSGKIHFTGFPVRPECTHTFTEKQLLEFKRKHNLRHDSHILTMMLGAAGGEALLSYSRELANIDPQDFTNPIEVNICVGRYEKMKIKIEKALLQLGCVLFSQGTTTSLTSPKGAIFHLRSFTPEIIELMACSSLIITKTGSCSVNEAIYLGRKLLLDNTEDSSARHLQWENFNVPFVRKHGLGDAFTDLKELLPLITLLVNENMGHPVATGALKLPHFPKELLKLVNTMTQSYT